MTTIAQQYNTRPRRSNSLQKMLDLEKQAMKLRRYQSNNGPVSITHQKSVPPRKPVPTRPGSHVTPPGTQANLPARTFTSQRQPLPHVNLSPEICGTPDPPLRYLPPPPRNTQRRQPVPRPTSLVIMSNHSSPPSTGSSSGYDSPHQEDIIDRRSVCQSPSWAAYDRRKLEEKQQRQEKKEQEQAAKLALRNKRARLSKQQPAVVESTLTASSAENQPPRRRAASTSRAKGLSMERPLSVLGLVQPNTSDSGKQRTRTGSLSSFMKVLDLRKASQDDAPSGFIGGIKLEQERFEAGQEAEQKAERESAENRVKPSLSEENIHPAFRSSPVVDDFSPPVTWGSDAAQNNNCQLAVNTQTASDKGHEFLSAETTSSSDTNTAGKWRARVGFKKLKPVAKADEPKNDEEERRQNIKLLRISRPILDDEAQRHVAVTLAKSSRVDITPATPEDTVDVLHGVTLYEPVKRSSSVSSNLSLPPPPPPRRSSKRKSWNALEGQLPPSQSQRCEGSPSTASVAGSPALSVPAPQSPSELSVAEQIRTHFYKNRNQNYRSNSSEDSSSDYSHSMSPPSTPATSRAASESGLTPSLPDFEQFFLDVPHKPTDSAHVTQQTSETVKQPRSFPLASRPKSKPVDVDAIPAASPPALNIPAKEKQEPKQEPIAKVFVECCSCKHYHDMPSKMYETMTGENEEQKLKCPWCRHGMSRKCCQGLAAMVYVKETLH